MSIVLLEWKNLKKKMGRKAIKRNLEADSKDIWNKYLFWPIFPSILIYISRFIFVHLSQVSVGDETVSIAKDSDLTVTTFKSFDAFSLNAHSFGGLLLLSAVLIQKRLIIAMNSSYATKSYASLATYHKILGYVILVLLLVMDSFGFLISANVNWDNFTLFSVGFALPWFLLSFFPSFLPFLLTLNHLWGNGRAIWLLSIYFTAASENYGLHRLLSNSMAKGCLTVPFARLCGGWLQKKGIPGAGGYYVGIGAVSILIALWQTFEIYEYITQKDKKE